MFIINREIETVGKISRTYLQSREKMEKHFQRKSVVLYPKSNKHYYSHSFKKSFTYCKLLFLTYG